MTNNRNTLSLSFNNLNWTAIGYIIAWVTLSSNILFMALPLLSRPVMDAGLATDADQLEADQLQEQEVQEQEIEEEARQMAPTKARSTNSGQLSPARDITSYNQANRVQKPIHRYLLRKYGLPGLAPSPEPEPLVQYEPRGCFPFMDLPGELRDEIYDLTIDLDSIDRFHTSMHQSFTNRPLGWYREPGALKRILRPRRRTPNILLLNKIIFEEAMSRLEKKSITFRHGLFHWNHVHRFVSKNILQTITILELNDSGHDMFTVNLGYISFDGHCLLVAHMANILATGHQLKKLTLSYSHPELAFHLHNCRRRVHRCLWRDYFYDALARWRYVHDIKEVHLVGDAIPAEFAAALAARIQGPCVNFLDLPKILRDRIYKYGRAFRIEEAAELADVYNDEGDIVL